MTQDSKAKTKVVLVVVVIFAVLIYELFKHSTPQVSSNTTTQVVSNSSDIKSIFYQTGGAWVDEEDYKISSNCSEIVEKSNADVISFENHSASTYKLRLRSKENKALDNTKGTNNASAVFNGNKIVETVTRPDGSKLVVKYRWLAQQSALEKYDVDVANCEKYYLACQAYKEGKTSRQKYCKGDFEKQIAKTRRYNQLFVCLSDSNYLPVAKALTETLIRYKQSGQDLAYAQIIGTSANHFSGSSVPGSGCTEQGLATEEMPSGDGELTRFSENNNYIFWIKSTHGTGGGAYTAIAESR
jgi:hypothetical protein